MRMLSQPVYALYVTHSDGEWRRLDGGECPLMVQLGWVQGNRDGRFLVKNEGDKYSLDQIRADIYGQEADDGFKKNDKNRKSSKKKNKKNAKKDNLATNLYNEVKGISTSFLPNSYLNTRISIYENDFKSELGGERE